VQAPRPLANAQTQLPLAISRPLRPWAKTVTQRQPGRNRLHPRQVRGL
jgi:hypothetical protein